MSLALFSLSATFRWVIMFWYIAALDALGLQWLPLKLMVSDRCPMIREGLDGRMTSLRRRLYDCGVDGALQVDWE